MFKGSCHLFLWCPLIVVCSDLLYKEHATIVCFLLELYTPYCIPLRLKYYLAIQRFQLTLGVQSHSIFGDWHYNIA